MVEQEAVNFKVAGSSPAPGARKEAPKGFIFKEKCDIMGE